MTQKAASARQSMITTGLVIVASWVSPLGATGAHEFVTLAHCYMRNILKQIARHTKY